ncbi:MAG: nucleotidyltransferase family protein [Ignavibacteriaceae bacterium]|jgi:molybdenum cofactor cytidylyltransferase
MLNSLLISAGLSSRMGNFKPLLLFRNEPIVISIIKKLLPISSKVFVVTGFKENELIKVIEDHFSKSELKDNIVFVSNHNYEKGMFTSLQKGLSEAKECNWLLYHFVDQPQVPEKFYEDLISQIDDKSDWIQPSFGGRKGHPVLLKNNLFKDIIEAEENSTLKDVINTKNINKKIWNCSYKEILIDIDTPEDYNLIAE